MSLRPRPVPAVPAATARIARAAFPKGCLAIRLRDELGVIFTDERFVEGFPAKGGPGLSPGMLALVSVLQFAEGLSDRQAADAVRGRIDWKYALGLELDDAGFDFSVLSEFRDRLIAGGLEQVVLEAVLERCTQAGLLRAGGRQRTDCTHVLAAVRLLNRLEFLGETLRAALEALAVAAPDWLAVTVSPAWIDRYGTRIDAYRFPKGEQARRRWAATVGQDGFALLEAVHAGDAPVWLRQLPAVQVLRLAWIQQFHRDHQGVRLRQADDLPPGHLRLASPYDVEARYGLKRGLGWCGYKVHLSETCEEDLPHLVTAVATTGACTDDSLVLEGVHERLQERGLSPAQHLVDAGYTSAAALVSARTGHGIELIGPVKDNNSGQARGALSQTAFTINWTHRQAICPQGATSIVWADKTASMGYISVRFAAADCTPCPLRQACTRSAHPRYGRSLTLLPQPLHQALAQRRAEQATPAWKAIYNLRAGIEATHSQAVRLLGMRRTRYRGLAKTGLGHVLTATALNLIRLDAWLQNQHPGKPATARRTTRLMRLAHAYGLAA
ncbi:IS1182 family transposase [Nonomuraea sp. NEAU-A123]|uniref:IS1182 family transposase n=1 Tax=Nonomuraea sp. NEAU-A123 TaxID=2839649 RepID=UPI001BE4DCC9|nr:IS1182 family transposase [Nonomuraea sp. NEAU-A123]MBT2235826.1 IS1182 family transposase [Nonomuraea sp. NEAU-A123]